MQGANEKKPRGRKPNPEGTEDTRAMQLMAKKQEQAVAERQEINKLFLREGETYNLHVCMEKARMYQEQMANGMLGLGAQLLLIKHNEVEHGNFSAVVENLGLAWRSANYAMAAARKFGANSHTCANLEVSKIRALTVLDDESIKTLEEGGALAGVGTIDEIEKMTVRELKEALRAEKKKRKEEREAQEAAISQKEQKLNELEMELRYREPPTQEELAQAELNELKKKLFRQIGEANHAIYELIRIVDEAQKIPNVNIIQLQEFINVEPEDFLSTIFDYTDELDEMIEYIRPYKERKNNEFYEDEFETLEN